MSSSVKYSDRRRPSTISSAAYCGVSGLVPPRLSTVSRQTSAPFSGSHSQSYLFAPPSPRLSSNINNYYGMSINTPHLLSPTSYLSPDASRLSFPGSNDYSHELISIEFENCSLVDSSRRNEEATATVPATRLKRVESKRIKDKKGKEAENNRRHHQALLSDADLEILESYYYHGLFSIARLCAFLFTLTAVILIILSISVPIWIEIPQKLDVDGPEYLYQLTMFNNRTVLLHKAQRSFFSDFRNLASGLKGALDRNPSTMMAATTDSPFVISLELLTLATTTPEDEDINMESTFEPYSYGATLTACVLTFSACGVSWLVAPTGLQITLWERCLKENATLLVLGIPCAAPQLDVWQSCIIGVLIFTSAFGSVSFVLSMCGLCVGSLPKRLYYYHSAAEMLFVCAILTGAAVIGFPLSIRYKQDIANFSYGHGFYIAIAGTSCYFISACLLNLDLFILCTVPAKDHREMSQHSKPRLKLTPSIGHQPHSNNASTAHA